MVVPEAKITDHAENANFHLFAPKSPFCSESVFWGHFYILSNFCTLGSKWPKKVSRNHYSHKLLSDWAHKTHFEHQNAAKCEIQSFGMETFLWLQKCVLGPRNDHKTTRFMCVLGLGHPKAQKVVNFARMMKFN